MNTYKTYCRANRIARLFYCYLLLLHIFAFRLCRCSTGKIGSKRDKLLLKTYRLPRVGLNKKFGSFFIYATISPFSLTSGFATLTTPFPFAFSGATPSVPKGKINIWRFSKMKKVFYSIRKVRNADEKISGLGFLNDEGTLFCKCVSKNGKRYTRAFDDVNN